ncbi:MAG: adenylate cyclase class IV, partial [Bacteriovoracaceae bacterium]
SLSLVSLGYKVEKAINKGKGELTAEDQTAILGDLEKLTGKTFAEVLESATDNAKKDAMIKDIAKKLGTSAQNLEDRILPELFNIK